MATYDYDIGIIGGGAAGLTVAAGASRFGAKTLLIEKEKALGGDCLHYGCVPSKTLISTARVYHLIRKAEQLGLPGIQVPPVSFPEIAGRIRTVIRVIQEHDSPERFCRLGVQIEFGEAEFIDEHAVRINGKTLSSKSWVIATGSSPAIPPVEGLDKVPFITNREIFSLNSLPGSMIILGGGPVATEMAQAFIRLGTAVTVIERMDQILLKEDSDMAGAVMETLKEEGVVFFLNAKVSSVRDLGTEREVVIRNGDGTMKSLRAETILVATGREANLKSLGLERIGVETDRRWLKLDRQLRTTQKHIYSAGDATGSYQFTHAAGYEGGVVLTNAILRLPKKADYTLLPWCTYTDPELASIGMNEKAAQEAGISYTVWTEEFMMNDRSLAEGSSKGKVKMILNEKERPVGVQIFGLHAGELISEWVAALNGKVRLSSIASAVHPYPTLSEINKRVVGTFYSGKIFSDGVKKALKFFFHLKGRACG